MLINSYVEEICKRIEGKNVLDVGCCASSSKNLLKRHFIYKKKAKSIVGCDYNKVLIKEAKERLKYEVLFCDFTNREDVQKIKDDFGLFDTLICTDVIEHVGNITNLLDNISYLMTDDAVLHLTTPNMRSPRWIHLANINKWNVNNDHVCWLEIFTLKILLKRSGLIVSEEMYHAQENAAIRALGLKPKPWMARRLYVTVKKES